jgi:uncharacterized protein YqeY
MLKEKIREDLNSALKEKKELKISVLRLLLATIFNKEKEKRYKLSKEKPEFTKERLEKESLLNDEEVLEVISSEIKKRKEAILAFDKAGRQDLLEKEKKEIEILEKYLPKQLSEEEIKKLAKEVIKEIGAKEIKEIGKVMAQLIPKIKGQAEGRMVNKIVKELLTPKNE